MRGVGLGIKAGLGAFKAGDMKQVGGEYDPGFVFCLFVLLRLLGCCLCSQGLFCLPLSSYVCLTTEAYDRFLIGPGEICHWGHRMTNTRDHTEIDELRKILKLNTIPEKDKVPGNEVETTVPVSEISNNAIDTPVS